MLIPQENATGQERSISRGRKGFPISPGWGKREQWRQSPEWVSEEPNAYMHTHVHGNTHRQMQTLMDTHTCTHTGHTRAQKPIYNTDRRRHSWSHIPGHTQDTHTLHLFYFLGAGSRAVSKPIWALGSLTEILWPIEPVPNKMRTSLKNS